MSVGDGVDPPSLQVDPNDEERRLAAKHGKLPEGYDETEHAQVEEDESEEVLVCVFGGVGGGSGVYWYVCLGGMCDGGVQVCYMHACIHTVHSLNLIYPFPFSPLFPIQLSNNTTNNKITTTNNKNISTKTRLLMQAKTKTAPNPPSSSPSHYKYATPMTTHLNFVLHSQPPLLRGTC